MKDIQSELFIVVNKKDEIIGYKTRYECHHDKSLIHRSTDIILFNKEGKIVLQKRSRSKDLYPGYYAVTASGHVSKGESWEAAASRELKEEMGVEGIHLERKGSFIVHNENETEMTMLFIGIYDGPFCYPTDEVESIGYFSKEEIKNIPQNIICSVDALKQIGWL